MSAACAPVRRRPAHICLHVRGSSGVRHCIHSVAPASIHERTCLTRRVRAALVATDCATSEKQAVRPVPPVPPPCASPPRPGGISWRAAAPPSSAAASVRPEAGPPGSGTSQASCSTKPQAVQTAPKPAPGPPSSSSALPHAGHEEAILWQSWGRGSAEHTQWWSTTRGGFTDALAASLASRTARSSASSTSTRYFSWRSGGCVWSRADGGVTSRRPCTSSLCGAAPRSSHSTGLSHLVHLSAMAARVGHRHSLAHA